MLTRRTLLLGAGAAALAPLDTAHAKASQPSTPVNFEIPAHACDTHTHLVGPKLWSGREYTHEPATPAEMAKLHRALHMERVAIITPIIHGTDNSYTAAGIKALGATARGVGLVEDNVTEKELARLDKLGFRGIRKDLRPLFRSNPDAARALFQTQARKLKPLGWSFDLLVDLPTLQGLKGLLEDASVPPNVDHFGFARAAQGLDQPGFRYLVDLVRTGAAYVKISACHRLSDQAPNYADIIPFARTLIAANPDRILWGTDWPHPAGSTGARRPLNEITPYTEVDDGHILNLLPVWEPDPKIREKILVHNPARLYRF